MNSSRFISPQIDQFEARLLLIVISSAFLIYGLFTPISFSQDADFLHYIHLKSCLTDSYVATRPTEIFLTLISKALPTCLTDADSFQRVLNIIIKILVVLVAWSHRNKMLGCIYLLTYFALAGSAFEHHFFRQYLASYLILILYIRDPTPLQKTAIAGLVLTVHTGTFAAWMMMAIFFRLTQMAHRNLHNLIITLITSLIFLILSPILIKFFYIYLFSNHGFAEIGQNVAFKSQVISILCGFLLIGFCHMILKRNILLLISSIITLFILIFNDYLGITGEFSFRVAAYIRYVFGIWLTALFFSDLLSMIQRRPNPPKKSNI